MIRSRENASEGSQWIGTTYFNIYIYIYRERETGGGGGDGYLYISLYLLSPPPPLKKKKKSALAQSTCQKIHTRLEIHAILSANLNFF